MNPVPPTLARPWHTGYEKTARPRRRSADSVADCVPAEEDVQQGRRAPSSKDVEQKGAPMKVRNSLRSLKNRPGAQIVRRRGRVYVINRKDPRGKSRQG